MNRAAIRVTVASMPDVQNWLYNVNALPQLPPAGRCSYQWLTLHDMAAAYPVDLKNTEGDIVIILCQTGIFSPPEAVWPALDAWVQRAAGRDKNVWLVLTGGDESARLANWNEWLNFATPGEPPMRRLWLCLLADLLREGKGPIALIVRAIRGLWRRSRV